MREPSITEKLPQQVASRIRHRVVDEQRLFLQRFSQTAAWRIVRRIQRPVDDVRVKIANVRQTMFPFEALAEYLAQHHLAIIFAIADVQVVAGCAVHAALERFEYRRPTLPVIDAPDHNVRLGVETRIVSDLRNFSLPSRLHQHIAAIDQYFGLWLPNIGWPEILPTDVGFRHSVWIYHQDIQSLWMPKLNHCKVHVGKPS